MRYYRTPEHSVELARDHKDRFSTRSDLLDIIQQHHGLVELGYFAGTKRYGFWVIQQGLQGQAEHSEFKASSDVLDFLVNEEVFSDMFIHHNTVALFGRMEGGQIVDIVALNYAALIDPGDL